MRADPQTFLREVAVLDHPADFPLLLKDQLCVHVYMCKGSIDYVRREMQHHGGRRSNPLAHTTRLPAGCLCNGAITLSSGLRKSHAKQSWRWHMQTLEAQGHKPMQLYRTYGLHPLAISLAEGDFSIWGQQQSGVLCLLRWPQPAKQPNMEAPLVLMRRGERTMQLVARSACEYVMRVLMQEDIASSGSEKGTVTRKLGTDAADVYMPGTAPEASKAEAYIVKEVGHFPDVTDSLMQTHLDKDDNTSAMVTLEWTMKRGFYQRWAYPYERAAWLYDRLSREEEARDTARLALRQPWWTVADLTRTKELAQMTGTAAEAYDLFEQSERGASPGATQVPVEEPSAQEVAERKASLLMDQVANGEVAGWDGIRPQLAGLLGEAGMTDAAAFIEAATRMNMSRGSLEMGVPTR